MQLVLGIIVGIFLTIGVAYVMDSGKSPVCPAGAGCPVVNWDEAGRALRAFQRGRFLRYPPADGALVSLRERRSIFQTESFNIRD